MNSTETAVNAEFVMSLTSAFDPEITNAGAQPRGFDQWANLYNNYRVTGVSYEIIVRPSSDSDSNVSACNIMCGVTAGPEGFQVQNFATIYDYLEYPKSKYHKYRLTARSESLPSELNAYNGSVKKFKGYINNYKLSRFYGQADASGTTMFNFPTDYSAKVNADPSAEQELTIWAASLLQDGDSLTFEPLPFTYADIRMVYYTTFWNPIFPAVS